MLNKSLVEFLYVNEFDCWVEGLFLDAFPRRPSNSFGIRQIYGFAFSAN